MLTATERFGEVFNLGDQLKATASKVAFKNVFETASGGVSLLRFEKGQELPEHLAPANVMVYVPQGSIRFTMAGNAHIISQGQFLLMGSGVSHSVVAEEDSLVMLVKVKD